MNLPSLKAPELKFLLNLLGQPGYRAAMSKLTPPGKSAKKRDEICEAFSKEKLVEYSTKIDGYSIEPSGKALLKLDAATLPISAEELKVLEAGKSGKRVTPGKISRTVPSARRQELIRSLQERGFVKVSERDVKLTEAWLTPQGNRFLREQFEPSGGATISLNLLKNYLTFMRQKAIVGGKIAKPVISTAVEQEQPSHDQCEKIESNQTELTSERVLGLIAQLDHQHNTDNYLPIYHLRENLSIERRTLDNLLYQLQREDKLELSTLQEISRYSKQEVASGIPQEIGGPLFFISLNA